MAGAGWRAGGQAGGQAQQQAAGTHPQAFLSQVSNKHRQVSTQPLQRSLAAAQGKAARRG